MTVALNREDKELLNSKGINENQLEKQIYNFETGFDFIKLDHSATINKGILKLSKEDADKYAQLYISKKEAGRTNTRCESLPVSAKKSWAYCSMRFWLTSCGHVFRHSGLLVMAPVYHPINYRSSSSRLFGLFCQSSASSGASFLSVILGHPLANSAFNSMKSL